MLIGVDFDYTLVIGDKPIEGAREAINTLREQGHKILIHSCNNPRWIKKVLEANEIRYDYIWGSDSSGHKPVCDVYIDDRALRFKGNWQETLQELAEFD